MICEVCEGDGRYPVINRHGQELYTILCPECEGYGVDDVDAEPEAEQPDELRRSSPR
jgi:DnaJ-class molecular chaperone